MEIFDDWYSVAKYAVQANCCPTMVIYERHKLSKPMSVQSVQETRSLLNDDQLLMLFLETNEMAGQNVDHLLEDEALESSSLGAPHSIVGWMNMPENRRTAVALGELLITVEVLSELAPDA